MLEADFSGYATKAGLKCSDGRTIMPGAFQQQDKMKVPLVWQHGHTDPENVLGHAILESRDDGVYCYGFFNSSGKAKHAAGLLEHKDINQLSIWANKLIERHKMVLHGAIKEVSLVLSGANPGAVIENVTIRHSDDDTEELLDDEAIIRTGLDLEHENLDDDDDNEEDDDNRQAVYDSLSDEQKEFVHSMLSEALDGDVVHAGEETVAEVYASLTDVQKQVVHFMIGEALDAAAAEHSNLDDAGHKGVDDDGNAKPGDDKKGNKMGTEFKHNVFEGKEGEKEQVLSHDDMKGILDSAKSMGSLKAAVEAYATDHLEHGINDIEVLFPDAVSVDSSPQIDSRRMEWVSSFLGAVKKSPFSRIRTLRADLTEEEARAKGYITGTLKKEEFFGVSKRVTTPTTIYKKQALDRDDVIDITDFDVVAWLKVEMRIMLDEEIARAALIGDGRDVAHEDKINEGNIRPIAKEHELFSTTIWVDFNDPLTASNKLTDGVIRNRKYYKGSGRPTFYTTEDVISTFLLMRDGFNRRMYKDLTEVAAELRVSAIVSVEAMEDDPTLLGVIVNPVDYTLGATRGGEVTMFEDFDIDYNKQKYLIETRCSGSLTKLKSAIVIRRADATDDEVTPPEPAFDGTAVTITNTPGVVYTDASDNSVMNAAGSPYAVANGETLVVNAAPADGYYFPSSEGDSWSFTNPA